MPLKHKKILKKSFLYQVASKVYHVVKRQTEWRLSGKKYILRNKTNSIFPVVVFHHETPLIRNLPKADLWLQYNKIINLKIAVSHLNGIIIHPGEYFSFWRLVGKPTKTKGYVAGMILNQGKIRPGIGGGLCQLSNLIYWMTLHSPLTVTERWRHSYDVFPDSNRTLPFGSGATCAYPSLDLQIKNTTPQPFQLILYLTENHLIGEWRSLNPINETYQVYESYHEITSDGWGNYVRHNVLRRKRFNAAKVETADELITENDALMMYPPFLNGETAD